MNTVLINYADGPGHFSNLQNINNSSGRKIGCFNKIFSYRRGDLGIGFYEKNKHILDQSRGAGYWLWKPYLIHRTLKYLDEGDVLFYCDSGAMFIKSISPVIDKLSSTEGVFLFHHHDGKEDNRMATKRDVYIALDCDNNSYYTRCCLGGYILIKNNNFARSFVKQWLHFCEDENLLTDTPNKLGKPNHPQYNEHRHDLSILTLIANKLNIPSGCDMTQYGNSYRNSIDGYDQLMHHHGGPNEGLINEININDYR